MSKLLENLSRSVIVQLIVTLLLSVLGTVIVFLMNLSPEIKVLLTIGILFLLLVLQLLTVWTVRRLAFSKKPSLVKAHNEPDTFIFLHGQWRKIPDWQTRDYLATVLGFRPGEEDVILKPKDDVDKLRKGPPLESIFAYARTTGYTKPVLKERKSPGLGKMRGSQVSGLWRLTFAKHLLNASGNLVSVATLMGHSRLDTTAIHTRASRQDMEWAVERLAEQ